ncbi:MAG TPA: lasso peptide biosynthesis B2 protein [Bacteroidales bacterium]
MNDVKKFFRLTPVDKKLFFEALFTSIRVKLMVTFLPLRWYARQLGVQHSLSSDSSDDNSYSLVYKISQAIVRCRKSIPWQNRCLVEAITAKRMLQKRGLQSTLYLGVNKKDKKMTAHAWLRCGTIFVTGNRGKDNFVTVNTFA